MCFPWALARFLPSAVRVRIRSRSTSASPPKTASIKRPVLVAVSAHGSAKDRNCALVVHPASRIRLLWVGSVTRGSGPGWGGCDDAPGARVERGGGAQAGADDALTKTGRGTGSPGADHPACG